MRTRLTLEQALILDASNNVYITGATQSSTFPTTANAFNHTYSGSSGHYDVIVAVISPVPSLTYATYLGGSADDIGYVRAFHSEMTH